jgi:uncharacterized membrane protein
MISIVIATEPVKLYLLLALLAYAVFVTLSRYDLLVSAVSPTWVILVYALIWPVTIIIIVGILILSAIVNFIYFLKERKQKSKEDTDREQS